MEENVTTSANVSSSQLRKIKKPIIERRRRERINDSLNQLKALVLDALNKDESRYSKMEKADILEMTVRHLKTVQAQQRPIARRSENTTEDFQSIRAQDVSRYRAGYQECAQEVKQYLGRLDGVAEDVQGRLLQHLGAKVKSAPVAQTTPLPTLHTGSTTVNIPQQQQQTSFLVGNSPVQLLPASAANDVISTPAAPIIAVMSPGSLPQGALLGTIPFAVNSSLPNNVSSGAPDAVRYQVMNVTSPKPADDATGCEQHSPTSTQTVAPIIVSPTSVKPDKIELSSSKNQLHGLCKTNRHQVQGMDLSKGINKREKREVTSSCHTPRHSPITRPHYNPIVKSHSSDLCKQSSDLDYSTKSVWRPW